MDDPWGSPWASSDAATTQNEHPTPSPPKNLLSPPPKAFFGGLSNLTNHSLWTGDDGLRVWTGAEQAEQTATSPGWGAWGDFGSHSPQLNLRADSPGKASPIAWPGSAATSPGLRPAERSRASSIFRSVSPDPWAAGSLWNDKTDEPSPVYPKSGSIPIDEYEFGVVEPSEPQNALVIHVDEPELAKQSEGSVAVPSGEGQGKQVPRGIAWDEPPVASSELRQVHTESVAGVEHRDSPSRPSSTFSANSEHGPDRQDSPITSIDEDPKFRPHVRRKVSTRVLELVDKFDGMARAASEEPPAQSSTTIESRGRSSSRVIAAEPQHSTDFGDLKDADPACERPRQMSTTSTSSNGSMTPKTRREGLVDFASKADTSLIKAPIPTGPSIPVQQLIDKFGPIKFEIDLQAIDKLFPDSPQVHDDEGPDLGGVSDRIIFDSFTTIEERKAWYRISRYGSMRKHNSGEEENYHRVAWRTSNLHDDTIRVVRRWMEEDSFSGKAMLGNKRTSTFNWDSTAAPVELDKIFGRKQSFHSRADSNASTHPPKQQPRSSGSIDERHESAGRITSLPPPAATVASFGWSSTAVKQPSAKQSAARDIQQLAKLPKPPQYTPSLGDAASKIVPKPPDAQPPMSVTGTTRPEDDEDDDWGEMVSSPINEAPVTISRAFTVESKYLDSPEPSLDIHTPQSVEHESPATARASLSIDSIIATPNPTAASKPDSQLSQQTPSIAPAPQLVSTNPDPWASADFSLFKDIAATSTQSATSTERQTSTLSTDPSLPSQKPTSPMPDKAPPATRVSLSPVQPSQDGEQEQLVRDIIARLPDLTYMLR
ncbi:uncharacterized protein BCR38DRAFT_416718 [Pseudomassariella vexata]|uniref:Uncharacterized protein n=1 Tax=Pseudomassariella vexata TaxID=1141098 RepID=A0A1Y2EJG1_9PEZI|nr:uncharacterized protein BCR38DRAFT_416718 [Pseudomassariella vexata]ORY71406.1 hypothetical protein BCR38DRAFT_416718 [Pseudomassariella vexata]